MLFRVLVTKEGKDETLIIIVFCAVYLFIKNKYIYYINTCVHIYSKLIMMMLIIIIIIIIIIITITIL